ncbi:hypothetical protein D9M71_221940 [compost metagenome]
MGLQGVTLAFQSLLAANIKGCIQRTSSSALDAEPGTLDQSEVVGDLAGAVLDAVGISLGQQLGSAGCVSAFLHGGDL